MSLEKDFHNFIESQNPEAKRRGIDKVLSARTTQRQAPVKKPFAWKKFLAVAAPTTAAVAVGLVLIFNCLPKDDGPRYCAIGDYYEKDTTQTLQEYVIENDLPMLYFDSTYVIDYIEHKEYRLTNNDEILGFKEDFIDSQGYLSSLRFTNKNTSLEELSLYDNLNNVSTVDNCLINYEKRTRYTYATFTYGNYRYYLEVEDVTTDYVLEMVGILIPDGE